MTLLVTGANGFLGRHVVSEALRRGHHVRALLRPASDDSPPMWRWSPQVEIVWGDLRSPTGWNEALAGVDAVVHLAAAKSGDAYAQYAGTVVATENLLAAMDAAGVRRIVGLSSMSVYNYRRIRSFSTLDESSPVEQDAFERDAYAHTKLVQERLIRDHARSRGWDYAILRPGAIFGPGNLFTARAGFRAGERMFVRTGSWARLPLTYVVNCAEAVIQTAEKLDATGAVYNVIDDEQPSQRRYVRMLRRRLTPRLVVVPVPWTALYLAAVLASITNALMFGGRAKIPGLLVPGRLCARCKPLRFTNRKLKERIGWQPRYGLVQALRRSTPVLPEPTDAAPGAPEPAAIPVTASVLVPRKAVA